MTKTTLGLATLFTALLTACADREIPGEDATASGGDTEPVDTEPDPSTTADPTTTVGTSAGPSTSEPPTTEPTTEPPPTTDSTFDTTEENQCVYADHHIVLTPEEYEQWLHGEATAGTDTGDTATGDTGDTGDTATDGTDTGTTTATTASSTTDGGTTSPEEAWSWELCKEICVALAGADEWNILECDKTGATPGGDVEILCVEILQHCDGRSHACITSRGDVHGQGPVGDYLARAAHDEAASVLAFAALAAELAAAGAPPELLARIQSAAADEVRHAKAVAALAHQHGATCRRPAQTAVPPRSLRDIAVENAALGCVRETWAAFLAAHQATWAADPDIRRTMHVIAADEARHAELAWAIDAWLRGVLDDAAWADVEAARTAAAAAVIAGVSANTPAPELVARAGLPDRARATRLVHGLAAALWPAAA